MNAEIEKSDNTQKGLSKTKKVIFGVVFVLGLIAFVYSYGKSCILALLEIYLIPMLMIYLYLNNKNKK